MSYSSYLAPVGVAGERGILLMTVLVQLASAMQVSINPRSALYDMAAASVVRDHNSQLPTNAQCCSRGTTLVAPPLWNCPFYD